MFFTSLNNLKRPEPSQWRFKHLQKRENLKKLVRSVRQEKVTDSTTRLHVFIAYLAGWFWKWSISQVPHLWNGDIKRPSSKDCYEVLNKLTYISHLTCRYHRTWQCFLRLGIITIFNITDISLLKCFHLLTVYQCHIKEITKTQSVLLFSVETIIYTVTKYESFLHQKVVKFKKIKKAASHSYFLSHN